MTRCVCVYFLQRLKPSFLSLVFKKYLFVWFAAGVFCKTLCDGFLLRVTAGAVISTESSCSKANRTTCNDWRSGNSTLRAFVLEKGGSKGRLCWVVLSALVCNICLLLNLHPPKKHKTCLSAKMVKKHHLLACFVLSFSIFPTLLTGSAPLTEAAGPAVPSVSDEDGSALGARDRLGEDRHEVCAHGRLHQAPRFVLRGGGDGVV